MVCSGSIPYQYLPQLRRGRTEAFFCRSSQGEGHSNTCLAYKTARYNSPMRRHDYAPGPAHLKWLLASDPAIRWHVMGDLTGDAPNAIAA